MASWYTIGVDFGTESGRALLVDIETGREVATAVYKYAQGVIDEKLPNNGPKLPPDFALQDPGDYLRTLEHTIPAVLHEAGIDKNNVIGIGIDFTACTILPTTAEGRPLCWDDQFRNNPHAWVKLWKHHAAQPEANAINEAAAKLPDSFLHRYGGKISSEWLFPKAWQILDEAPEVYEAAARFIEAGDWVVWQLSGVASRNACAAGYKAIWAKDTGYPSAEFLASLNPKLSQVVENKMAGPIVPAGTRVGGLTPAWADKLGLNPGIAIAAAIIDAHVAVPAATVTEPGKVVMVMGTSTCHMVLSTEQRVVEGMSGVVADGIIPGYFGYEAGQAAVGDIFAWFVENCVPGRYETEAAQRGVSVYELLEEKAASLQPGESGLLALDWWNGNRMLGDTDLSGMLVGYTLLTKAEEVYRALFEATAYGANMLVNAFESSGVAVRELYACGGLPMRSPLLMQIYADVTGRSIKVAASQQTGALGSAMFAAVAAGPEHGGYASIVEAAQHMARLKDTVYSPDPTRHAVYQQLYAEYVKLHNYFGRTADVVKHLRRLREEALMGNTQG